MKTAQKLSMRLKVGLGVLVVLFLGTVFFAYQLFNDKKEIEKSLIAEKEQIISNLTDMTKQYDNAIAENTIANQDLIVARGRIEDLVDSLKLSQNSVSNLMIYRKKFLILRKEMEVLLEENDKLKVENQLLATSLDSTQIQLAERTEFTDLLLTQNSELTSIVKDASVIQTVGLKGFGIIERINGKQIPTERAKRSDKIKVCFTVAKNTLANAGDRELYIQVIDSKNNTLGLNNQIQFGDEVLSYSLVSRFNYKNRNLNICEYLSADDKKFESGRYIINVFDKENLISTSDFVLKK